VPRFQSFPRAQVSLACKQMTANTDNPGPAMPVRAASHARIAFDAAAPSKSIVAIDYLDNGTLLACERRPVAVGAQAVRVKTHPDATHVSCSLLTGKKRKVDVRFTVDCGEAIQPVGRHFIVIGAMKAGTTTLFRLLAKHPALCRTWVEVPGVSFPKEVNYFRNQYRRGDSPLRYDWRFPFDPARHAWTLDVSPNYAKLLGSKAVPARIASLGAQTKLAYILREPIDRIESQIRHKLRHHGDANKIHHCKRVSQYALHLDRFTAHIPREDILLLDFKQLCDDPAGVMGRVCDFLGTEHHAARVGVHHRSVVRYSLSREMRADLTDALRPDVQRLIDEYGFEPAKEWLQDPKKSWLRMPRFRR
jgi:hypothetical protein